MYIDDKVSFTSTSNISLQIEFREIITKNYFNKKAEFKKSILSNPIVSNSQSFVILTILVRIFVSRVSENIIETSNKAITKQNCKRVCLNATDSKFTNTLIA